MTRIEHLLWIIAEECAEVAQRASKAARFTLEECQPGQDMNNEQRLWQEFNDLMAVMDMLAHEREHYGASMWQQDEKKKKVEHFLKYSAEQGTLTA